MARSPRREQTTTQTFCDENFAKQKSLKVLWNSQTLLGWNSTSHKLSFTSSASPSSLPARNSQSGSVSICGVLQWNANTFSIMNIWETPVENSSDCIPGMLLATGLQKSRQQTESGSVEARKEGRVLCCFKILSSAMPCCSFFRKANWLGWLLSWFLILIFRSTVYGLA